MDQNLLKRSPVGQFLARYISSSIEKLKNGLEYHFVKNLFNPSPFK